MKIDSRQMSYEEMLAQPRLQHKNPRKPSRLLAAVVRIASMPTLLKTKFSYTTERMELVGKEPCLILMNHSSFTDMKLAYGIFYPRRFGIVTSVDAMSGFLGKLMRFLGCTPTHKYITDLTLIRDIEYMLKTNKTSVLMYPEAGYSFDGTATALPRKLGVLMKRLGVPVVTVITQGAFARQPLYNGLRKRKVKTSAEVTCLFTPEDLKTMTVAQLDEKLDEMFSFDNFRWQQENHVLIDTPDRAEGLNRILYKCPHCLAEGKTEGKGTKLVCHGCGAEYELTELGFLAADNAKFTHVPDWYRWQRQEVRKELEAGTYKLDIDVEIAMMVNYNAIYKVGEGHLTHTVEGFHLTGCEGKLDYTQGPLACYGLYADYFWYEIADMICIGNQDVLYYCFPKNCGDVVAKTRLATEELYKMKKVRKPRISE